MKRIACIGRIAFVRRRAVSSVGVATVFSVALALGIWAALEVFLPGQAGFGSGGVGTGRGPIMIAVGIFALTMFTWSRLHSKKGEDL